MKSPEIILISVIFFALIVIFTWIIKTERRFKRFFMGKKGKDIEEAMEKISNAFETLSKKEKASSLEIAEINRKLKQSVRGVGTVRFNPFKDSGGNQSFALSLLNEDDSGVVISSLYARERMSVYAKPITQGRSEYELTSEEKEAIEKAKVS